MSRGGDSELLQRTIELNYANRKRSSALKWIAANALFLLIFVYDLSCKCPGYTSTLHYIEMVSACVLVANLVQYAVYFVPSRVSKLPLSPVQQKLLGLSNADLDSSFVLSEGGGRARREPEPEPAPWPRRVAPPPAPPAAPAPDGAPALAADDRSLADYLQRCAAGGRPAPLYQLATPAAEPRPPARAPGEACAPRSLEPDPRRLTQWNRNLRLWLHATVLAPLARELRAADEALVRLGLAEAGALLAGRVEPRRLRELAPQLPALGALAPYVEGFADRAYATRRLLRLARGAGLAAYRWDGGGADWEPARPQDAELLLHAVRAYLAAQLAGGGEAELGLLRLRARPPHYALAWRGLTLAPRAGRDNLLHALLLLLLAAARRRPPTLGRTPLGPAGLNMLWIVGR